ncbi:MAG TPA: tRNA pseudouridine(38-40) synthase TruA [Parachlamydiaceae bacterium]|nr:tRNA pseudouridine(38-40) synthase TruA [Parachlamydiaceae bacterium]
MNQCYKMTIAYEGTNYAGWQVQPNGLSIQEVIETKLQLILKEKVKIRGSGRTDAKVHAKNQVAHFHFSSKIDLKKVIHSLNALLPADIQVKSIEEADENFHAQYSAVKKIYHYHIQTDPFKNPFKWRYSWHMRQKLDLNALAQAAKLFLGTHDFTSFANEADSGSAAHDATRTLMRLDLIEEEGGFRLEFEGDGFLYKMVRNLTGFLIEVARGKRKAAEIPIILAAKDRKKAGPAAPPEGLFLVSVHY